MFLGHFGVMLYTVSQKNTKMTTQNAAQLVDYSVMTGVDILMVSVLLLG